MRADSAKKWIRQCADVLFLKDWQIDVRVVDELDSAHAKVDFESSWHAVVTIDQKFLKKPARLQKMIVAHELLHCLHKETDDAAGTAGYEVAMERFVERMESILCQIIPRPPA